MRGFERRMHARPCAQLQPQDEQQIIRLLVRRFGGLAALQTIHERIQQQQKQGKQQQRPPQNPTPRQLQHQHPRNQQQQQQHQGHTGSAVETLYSDLGASLRIPTHVWVAALEHETSQGAPAAVQAIVELLRKVSGRGAQDTDPRP